MKKIVVYLLSMTTLIMLNYKTNAQCPSLSDDCSNFTITMPSSSHTICEGTSYTFDPLVTYNTTVITPVAFSWTPVSDVSPSMSPPSLPTTTIITPTGGPGSYIYNLKVSGLGPNIVQNGDFSLGNSCFTHDPLYSFTTPVDPTGGAYNVAASLPTVLTSSWDVYCTSLSMPMSGSPDMMIINGSVDPSQPIFWEETLSVCKNATYTFSMNLGSWSGLADGTIPSGAQPQIQVSIGTTILGVYTIISACSWNTVSYTWTAPAGVTVADIQIRDLNNSLWYNDFSVDNISFQRNVSNTVPITITVIAPPTPISGPNTVCVGSVIMLSDATPGGTWSGGGGYAIVGMDGSVVGGSAGSTNITYSNACGVATYPITVNPLPAPISGPSCMCVGSTTTFTDAVLGGSWTSSPVSIASVDPEGDVTGMGVGIATVTYGFPGCYVATTVNVTTPPAPITGTPTVCVGATTPLSEPTAYGSWGSLNVAIATVDISGNVFGVAAGTTTITFTNCCGTASFSVTVNPLPSIGTLTYTGCYPPCPGTPLTFDITGGTSGAFDYFRYIDPIGGSVSTLYVPIGPGGIGHTGVIPLVGVPGVFYYEIPGATSPEGCNTLDFTPYLSFDLEWPFANFTSQNVVYGCNGCVTLTLAGGQGDIVNISYPGGAPITVTLDGSGNGTTTVCPITTTTVFTIGDVTSPDPGNCCTVYSGETITAVPAVDPPTCVVFTIPSLCMSGPMAGTSVYEFSGAAYSTVSFTLTNYWGTSPVYSVTLDVSGHYFLNEYLSDGLAAASTDACHPDMFLPFIPDCVLSGVCPGSGPWGFATVTLTAVSVPNPDGSSCTFAPYCQGTKGGRLAGNSSEGVSAQGSHVGKDQSGPIGFNESVAIIPNPNKGTFTVQGGISKTTSKEAIIEIVDIVGQIILTDVAQIENGSINKNITLSDGLANGQYLVRIKADGASQVLRFTLDR